MSVALHLILISSHSEMDIFDFGRIIGGGDEEVLKYFQDHGLVRGPWPVSLKRAGTPGRCRDTLTD